MRKLQELRQTKRLSQSQLAKAADVNVRTLQHYEQGLRDINSANIKTLISLSTILECKVIDILDDLKLIEVIKNASIK
ncbi:MAG: helix-turn-helix domain-containing protein [Bacillus sp. (in: firmicutes)]